ncbi:MAG: glycosyltransferase family 4 protein [Candidatus Njordarchaeales archaeon]
MIHGERKNLDIYKKAQEVIIPFFKRRKHSLFPIRALSIVFSIVYDLIRTVKIIRFCRKEKIDVIHIPHLAGASAPPWGYLFWDPNRLVVTLHGVAPLVVPPKLYFLNRDTIPLSIKIEVLKWKYFFRNRFKIMIAVSYSEKRNISRKLSIPLGKIKVIHHGADHVKCILEKKRKFEKILYQKYGIDSPFVFHLCAYQPKKNVERIIVAFAIAKKKYKIKEKLVIGGKQPDHLKRLVKSLGIGDDVVFVGFIPEEELPIFYSTAKAFIFPSLHESFGMPILEAMVCGCPVITSNVFSMPEVAGDTAILVNPYNTEEIAEAIYEIVTNSKLRKELAKRGLERTRKFTWERCVKEHLNVYLEAYRK